MEQLVVRCAQKADFEAISKIIALQNQKPETHCIHSDTGEDAQIILGELIRLDAEGEICFFTASMDGRLMGVMGYELDEELGRGWLRGPFIADDRKDWTASADQLFDGLLDSLPESIRQLDTYLNIENLRGNNFYLGRAFKRLRLVHVYECLPSQKTIAPFDPYELLLPGEAQEFVGLHDTLFPGTYATGQRILEKIDGQHQVFVYKNGNEIMGYLYTVIDEDTADGSIEFIGVREDARGKGIGRQLLQTALHWLFEIKLVPKVMLVVNDDLSNARSLYESVGFRLKYTGVHNRKVSG
ncbi:MAG: GNAT family N-acetyltransferase [Anaerolineaceae bacterium]